MKELSIEEKAKAYDEAKLRMSAAYNSNRCTIGFMNEIFPELAESEDERMIKSINRLIRYYHDVNFPTPEGFSRKDLLDWIEKQGKQKPTDKVEPKFKAGDWVVSNEHLTCRNSLMRIVKVGLTDYLCRYYNGQTTYCREFIDKNYHLWTIQDAKDGVKMKDAGYEWDANKKELKKIKQKSVEWSEKDEKNLNDAIDACKARYGNMSYTADWLKSLKDRIQPQHEWSEEDNRKIEELIALCKGRKKLCSPTVPAYKRMDELKEWLKSLRPQNWTKEDKERYESCLQRLSTGNPEQPETINSKWFKEHVYPKPQSTWRPSDRQIEILKDFLFHIPKEVPEKVVLVSLYHDLLKLKE